MAKIIKVPIEENWAGVYRIEYDSKYITLFGKDKDFPIQGYGMVPEDELEEDYEEMVLVPIVEEIRNAEPKILKSDDKFIYIDLGLISGK